jgi:hypothetical protein
MSDDAISHLYTLDDDREPRPCISLSEWLKRGAPLLLVAITAVRGVNVITLFLGFDAAGGRSDRPDLFETRIAGSVRTYPTWRYSTWTEAEYGHARAVEQLKRENH